MAWGIDTSIEKLDNIAKYVDDFQRKVNEACTRLSSAVNDLKRSNSNEDIRSVDKMLKMVENIIKEEQPTFNKLKKAITDYSSDVAELKKILSE